MINHLSCKFKTLNLTFYYFILTLFKNRIAIISLAKHNFRIRYLGTIGGLLWGVLLPIATVFTYWAVFSVGFKATGPNGMPFDIYFIVAYLPWSFLTEVLSASSIVVINNPHLVKKMVFPTEVLPVVEIISATFNHLILFSITIALLVFHGTTFGLGFFQIFYSYLCLVTLALGLSWLLAAANIFYRDIGQILSVVLNFWFWATPIAWSIEIVPIRYQWVMDLNPAFHIINGYRDALLYDTSLWTNMLSLIFFWIFTTVIFILGGYVFRKLKPEFADVL